MERNIDYNHDAIIKLINSVIKELSSLEVAVKLDDLDIAEINVDTDTIIDRLDNLIDKEVLRRELISDIKNLLTTYLPQLNNLELIKNILNLILPSVINIEEDVDDNKNTLGNIEDVVEQIRDLIEKEYPEPVPDRKYRTTSYKINQSDINATSQEYIVKAIASRNDIETYVADGEVQYLDVIHEIHELTNMFVGKYNTTTNKLEVKKVNKLDKQLYDDETQIVITPDDELDMFIKLPPFYWKCVEEEQNIYNVEFALHVVDETGWNYWEGNTFIGVYEGFVNNNKLYSKPNVTPTGSVSYDSFKEYSRARQSNYSLIKYETHIIMALLGYGWLADTNSQGAIGKGTTDIGKVTGLCDLKGFADTVAAVDGNIGSINFWGLENWWGDISEYIDNIETANDTGLINVLDYNNNIVRAIQAGQLGTGLIGQFVLGPKADLIPKEIHSSDIYATCFADGGKVVGKANNIAYRSNNANYNSGGIGYIYIEKAKNASGRSFGTRVEYKGDYEIVNNFNN